MNTVIDLIKNNPELVGVLAVVIESAVMPFVPVKWNGLAHTLFTLLRSKSAKK